LLMSGSCSSSSFFLAPSQRSSAQPLRLLVLPLRRLNVPRCIVKHLSQILYWLLTRHLALIPRFDMRKQLLAYCPFLKIWTRNSLTISVTNLLFHRFKLPKVDSHTRVQRCNRSCISYALLFSVNVTSEYACRVSKSSSNALSASSSSHDSTSLLWPRNNQIGMPCALKKLISESNSAAKRLSVRSFSFTRILQLVQDPFSAYLGFHSLDTLYKRSRITLLSYFSQSVKYSYFQPVIFNPLSSRRRSPESQ
jgi:hypothetical protein